MNIEKIEFLLNPKAKILFKLLSHHHLREVKISRLDDEVVPTKTLIFSSIFLREVYIPDGNVEIDDFAIQCLRNLRVLDISRNKMITNTCLKYLKKLQVLIMNQNVIIRDYGIEHMDLIHLEVSGSHITDKSVSKMKNLTCLYKGFSKNITKKSLGKLRNLKIMYGSMRYLSGVGIPREQCRC